jgi:hypothetical protein
MKIAYILHFAIFNRVLLLRVSPLLSSGLLFFEKKNHNSTWDFEISGSIDFFSQIKIPDWRNILIDKKSKTIQKILLFAITKLWKTIKTALLSVPDIYSTSIPIEYNNSSKHALMVWSETVLIWTILVVGSW